MALYVDSAFLNSIMEVAQTLPLAGVTTNPSIILAAQTQGQMLSPLELLRELLARVEGYIFIQPGATGEEEMHQQALSYIEADPLRVIPKIPLTHVGMRVARRLKRKQRRLAFTAVTSVAQAYSAAMIEADYVIPYFNRLERAGIDASERIAEMAELFHNQQLPTRILVASIKSSQEAVVALAAGAHDITAAPEVLLDMLVDPMTEDAVAKFTHDWQMMKKV